MLVSNSKKLKNKTNGSASIATFKTPINQMSPVGIATNEIEKFLILRETTKNSNNSNNSNNSVWQLPKDDQTNGNA